MLVRLESSEGFFTLFKNKSQLKQLITLSDSLYSMSDTLWSPCSHTKFQLFQTFLLSSQYHALVWHVSFCVCFVWVFTDWILIFQLSALSSHFNIWINAFNFAYKVYMFSGLHSPALHAGQVTNSSSTDPTTSVWLFFHPWIICKPEKFGLSCGQTSTKMKNTRNEKRCLLIVPVEQSHHNDTGNDIIGNMLITFTHSPSLHAYITGLWENCYTCRACALTCGPQQRMVAKQTTSAWPLCACII